MKCSLWWEKDPSCCPGGRRGGLQMALCVGSRGGSAPHPLRPQLPSSLPSGSAWVCSWDGLEIITSWFFQKRICPTLETLLWLSTYISGTNTEDLQKEVSFGPDSPPLQACFPNQLCPQHLASFIPRCRLGVFMDWFFDSCVLCGWKVRSSVLFFFQAHPK